MTKRDLKIVQDSVAKTIKETVNGKIDNLKGQVGELKEQIEQHNRRHEADMQDIKPFIQGARGIGMVWKIVIGFVGILVLFGQLKQLFPQI